MNEVSADFKSHALLMRKKHVQLKVIQAHGLDLTKRYFEREHVIEI